MGDIYKLHTVQIYRAQKLGESGIHLLDTTAKSGNPAWAPAYSDVMAYKDGSLSKADYTEIYLHRMATSQACYPEAWKELLNYHNVAIACYCAPGKFCHRHLFLPLHKVYLEAQGHTVELMGEFNGVQYLTEADQPPSVVSIPFEQKIVPFYGPEDPLSNHHFSDFIVKGVKFNHNEKFIMYCKAMFFKDLVTAEKILKAHHPQQCKLLGRDVTPYNDPIWKTKRRGYSFIGSYQKALQNTYISEYLLATGNAILVEAAKHDRDWGVGIGIDDPRIYDMSQWNGANIQGEVWTDVRTKLQEHVVF